MHTFYTDIKHSYQHILGISFMHAFIRLYCACLPHVLIHLTC